MNQYVTGAMIKALREKKHMTQVELADYIHVSDKTVSKWENGKGFPDISLIQTIAEAFQISVVELLDGIAVNNTNVSANMLRAKFYVCPVCGNVIHSMGETLISCHGITLPPLEAEQVDDLHQATIDIAEDEYFGELSHDMTKQHYISLLVVHKRSTARYHFIMRCPFLFLIPALKQVFLLRYHILQLVHNTG